MKSTKLQTFFVLASAVFLSACAGTGSSNKGAPVSSKGDEGVVLSGGPGCNATPGPLRGQSQETHRCYFPTTGPFAKDFATSAQRMAYVQASYERYCSRLEILSDHADESKAALGVALWRVGFRCQPK